MHAVDLDSTRRVTARPDRLDGVRRWGGADDRHVFEQQPGAAHRPGEVFDVAVDHFDAAYRHIVGVDRQ